MYYTDNDFRLYHHGILGQKWGVRRYQNADGSLTAAGRKRLAKDLKKIAKKHGYYSQEVKDRIKQDISDNQIARVKSVQDKFSKRVNSVEDKLEKERTDAIVKETDRLVDDEMKRNPTAYKTERDVRKLREYYSDLAEDNVFDKHPELFISDSLDKAYDDYNRELREIGRDILKEYSDMPIKKGGVNNYDTNAAELVAFTVDRIDYQQKQERTKK